jgi:hypothetical protein
MPVPQDLVNPPSGMPEDLTANEQENRALHSQFNALAARARYLGGYEERIARDCGLMAKHLMKPLMRDARAKLGKDATLTELRDVAEDDPDVLIWHGRQKRHSDRAEAYRDLFSIYTKNVEVLSRDLTWSGAEQQGA